MADYTIAIGFLVAVKPLFRLGEIKNNAKRKESEYLLIGSLLSFGVAARIGYIVKAMLIK